MLARVSLGGCAAVVTGALAALGLAACNSVPVGAAHRAASSPAITSRSAGPMTVYVVDEGWWGHSGHVVTPISAATNTAGKAISMEATTGPIAITP